MNSSQCNSSNLYQGFSFFKIVVALAGLLIFITGGMAQMFWMMLLGFYIFWISLGNGVSLMSFFPRHWLGFIGYLVTLIIVFMLMYVPGIVMAEGGFKGATEVFGGLLSFFLGLAITLWSLIRYHNSNHNAS